MGTSEGPKVGLTEGFRVGISVGRKEGGPLGAEEGFCDGPRVGIGELVGETEGASDGSHDKSVCTAQQGVPKELPCSTSHPRTTCDDSAST